MTKNNNELLNFHNSLNKNLDKLEKENDFINNFYSSFIAGQTEIYQKEVSETKKFDEEWIKTIESYFPSINKIALTPRSNVKLVDVISPIEKARKIDSRSIKHLSANTHMLRQVNKDGTVVPSRILTSYSDIDYELYENRFIMTLIDRLFIFVRSRYDIIKNNVESFDKRQVKIKSTFPVNNTKVDFNLDVTLIDEIENKEINIYNKMLLKRVSELNKLVTSLKTSNFMELMKNAKKIHPPIMKTNIIMKDNDYHNAYLLWLFIDRYNTLAFTLDVLEKDLPFSNAYLKDIKRTALQTFSTITYNHLNSVSKYKEIEEKPEAFESIKVITKDPSQIKYEPKDIVVEDQMINEYYLEMNKKIFEKSLQQHQESTKTDETAIKRALRDTLKISKALYSAYFNLEDERDIFSQLVKDVNVSKEFDETKHKIFIAKMIREVKEVDYNDSIRLERRLLSKLKNFDELLLKENVKKLASKKSQLELEKQKAEEHKLIEQQRINLLAELENVKNQRDEINALRIETNKKINAYRSALKNKLDEEIKKLAKEHDRQTSIKINRLNRELETHQRVNALREKSFEAAENKRLEKALLQIDEEFEKEKALALEKLAKKHQLEIKQAEIKLRDDMRKEQARLLESLDIIDMKARGKRQKRRVLNRTILVEAIDDANKKHEEKLAELKK